MGLSVELFEDLVGKIEVSKDVLTVVVFVEEIVEFQNLAGDGDVVHDDGVLGQEREAGTGGGDAGGLQMVDDGVERFRRGEDGVLFAVGVKIIGTAVHGNFQNAVFIGNRRGKFDLSPAFEHEGHASGTADVAAIFAEDDAQVVDGPVLVIGNNLNHEGCSAGTKSFVNGFFDDVTGQFSSPLLDSAVNIVRGHVYGFGSLDGTAQAGVGVWIASAAFGCYGEFSGHFAEHFAFPGIDAFFDMLDFGPLVVTGHDS